MGHKVHPCSVRLDFIKNWSSQWFAKKREYARMFCKDWMARDIIMKELPDCGIADVLIEMVRDKMLITILSAKPGLIIGEKGVRKNALVDLVAGAVGMDVAINIVELRRPLLSAAIVAETVAKQIEQRISIRRVVKRVQLEAAKEGALGTTIRVSGKLSGEIARSSVYKVGSMPIQTFRSDIDFAIVVARVPLGAIGVKVWVYRGEVYNADEAVVATRASNIAANLTNQVAKKRNHYDHDRNDRPRRRPFSRGGSAHHIS